MTQRKILIADDEELIRNVYADFLSAKYGNSVSIDKVDDGLPLLESARAANPPYALIISDDNMTSMNGLEALMELRGEGKLGEAMLITSIRSPRRAQQIHESGIPAYPKPILPGEFFSAVDAALKRYDAKNSS